MKYNRTIISLFVLNIVAIISLLYFANISRSIEKQNSDLKEKINYVEEQININEIEYSLYNNYNYLKILQNIYFEKVENINLNQRISFYELSENSLDFFYTVGTQ